MVRKGRDFEDQTVVLEDGTGLNNILLVLVTE